MSTGSAQQTSTTTAGVSPFAQNYVDAMLGAGQQQVFNMTPGEGGVMNKSEEHTSELQSH